MLLTEFSYESVPVSVNYMRKRGTHRKIFQSEIPIATLTGLKKVKCCNWVIQKVT